MNASTQEATDLAAWHATKLLSGSRSMCKAAFGGDEVQAAIAGFSGSCTMGMSPKRVAYQAATVRKIMAMLPAE
jgi:predicted ATPase